MRLKHERVVFLHLHAHGVGRLGQSVSLCAGRKQLNQPVLHVPGGVPAAHNAQLSPRLHVFGEHPEHLLDHVAERVLELRRVPSGDLAARLLQRLNRRRRGHAQTALSAGELVLAAVLLHRVRQVYHHLVDLVVERRGLRGLHHLADVVALPLDDRLGKVGHVVRVDAAVLAHIGALDGGKARVVVDVLLVAVDCVLRVAVVVHKARAERAAVNLAVAVERERIEPVRVDALAVFALSRDAVVRLRGG